MQATLPSRRSRPQPAKSSQVQPSNSLSTSSPVAEEIHAFIAMRDLLLAEAEEETTEANLHRLWMANEFAERCLEPARAPYEGQSLPGPESQCERQRCKAIKIRIAELRTRIRRRAA